MRKKLKSNSSSVNSYFPKSAHLHNVEYAPRGRLNRIAENLQSQGYRIRFYNLGNPPDFRIYAPEELPVDVCKNIHTAEAYSADFQGNFPPRKSVMQRCQRTGIEGVQVEDVYMTNGATGALTLALQALVTRDKTGVIFINPGYPGTMAIAQALGTKIYNVHTRPENNWLPDPDVIKSLVRKNKNIRAIIINSPHNPTGTVYPLDILQKIARIAVEHQLIVISDEVYDELIYNRKKKHIPIASLSDGTLFITICSLAKNWRACGYKGGWLFLSGSRSVKDRAQDYIQGMQTCLSWENCSNVLGQLAVQTSLDGKQSVLDLTKKGGKLWKRREALCKALKRIEGVELIKPDGALYIYFGIDKRIYTRITGDMQFCESLLNERHVLLVPGIGMNHPERIRPHHAYARTTFLDDPDDLVDFANDLRLFLEQRQ